MHCFYSLSFIIGDTIMTLGISMTAFNDKKSPERQVRNSNHVWERTKAQDPIQLESCIQKVGCNKGIALVLKAQIYAGCFCSGLMVRWKKGEAEVEEQAFHCWKAEVKDFLIAFQNSAYKP